MSRLPRAALLAGATLVAIGCEERGGRTRKVLEPYAVVPGTPQVDTGAPKVLTDPTRETSSFSINVPRQCDLYQQLSVRKVDILWVVDSSGSMAPKQARLAANFNGFISQLVNAKPPIDFHIAVTPTDTDDPATRGALRKWIVGPTTSDFIACTPQPDGTSRCNTNQGADGGTSEAVTAFQQMATVGTAGSAQERGLLAAYLALTNPNNLSKPGAERFIRPEAALYVVVVSDEDDSSCHPLVTQSICTADPGCRCAPDAILGGAGAYGSTSYFTRFLETYKGYGQGELVALAAIVALEGTADAGVPSQFGDPNQHAGCCRSASALPCPTGGQNDGGYEIAYFGGRYVKVASDTGGVAVSICDSSFSGALASLGYAASGLRREFRLTRGPDVQPSGGKAAGIQLYVSPPNAANCQVDGNCPAGQFCRSNRCARKLDVDLAATKDAAQYVKCDASAFRNVVRFDGAAVPESLSAVEICYDVQAEFQTSCP
ncbi:MAG: hypothetical protein HYZ28_16995 [Myxococcales bacterium]|nr:hypothetical protein [Myxococcales bacterium]